MTTADRRIGAAVESGTVADGMSPYATGGGGVVLEHRVVARYMVHMLAGTTLSELKGRAIVRITCQEAAAVDDVIIHAHRSGEAQPSLRLAVASRRAPDLVPSNPKSQRLITSFIRELRVRDDVCEDGLEHRIGLVVAGRQQHAEQLKSLAALAEPRADAEKFFEDLHIPKKFDQNWVTRLECLEQMVTTALKEVTGSAPGQGDVRRAVLELLRRLDVGCLNLEAPDTSDWDELANTLVEVSRDGTLESAIFLLERIETLAGQWVPRGADFDSSILRRHVHHLINAESHRRSTRWARLTELERIARLQVRMKITTVEGATVGLDRGGLAGRLRTAVDPKSGLIVHGESGVGKSALVLETLTQDAQSEPEQTQVVCLNLERLPIEPISLLSVLGAPLRTALADLSAPRRFLVIDGADAALREHGHTFRYLINEAREAECAVIAVASDTGFETVRDTLREQLDTMVPDFTVPPLESAELDALALRLPALARLLLKERSRKLLSRLVVIDLLMRGSATAPVYSDLDALQQVWEGLVRRPRSPRGGATARELVMQRLAQRELSGGRGRTAEFLSTLNADALDGLIEDGLLLRTESTFTTSVPVFAHDEIRRYAVARVLIDEGEPARVLAEYCAPRWAMPAARLACQGLLDDASRSHGALTDLQASFDQLVAQHGRRWADVPAEALLACSRPSAPLIDAWTELRRERWFGVHRLCRLIFQQQSGAMFVDLTAIEPIVALLLREERPWQLSRTIETFLRRWLVTLALCRVPAGHPLRVQLRTKLITHVEHAEQAMPVQQTQGPGGSPRASSIAAAFEPRTRSGGRIFRPRLPHELTDEATVTLLTMLSADLGPQGDALLKRLARDAPHHLAVAVETPGSAAALVEHSYELLAHLTEAYYIDQTPMGQGIYDDGVRRHQAQVGRALAAWEYGPFAVLLARDFRAGARVVNRILNHAVRCRINPNLVGDDDQTADLSEDVIEQVGLRAELVPGHSAVMLGDVEVWSWFRGSGRMPYPCLSALFAVERQSDLLAASGVALSQIRGDLLADCENLAMPAVLLDLLTRNIEQTGDLIEPFLADPEIWEADIARRASQQAYGIRSGYQVTNSERKTWMLQDTAMYLALHADAERADRLRAIRQKLVEDVANAIEAAKRDLGADWTAESQQAADEYAALVDTRTGALDADRLTFERAEAGIKVSAASAAEIQELLIPRQVEQAKANQLLHLHNRYHVARNLRPGEQAPYSPEEIIDDLDTACALVTDPPDQWPAEPWDVAAEIAATALYEHIVAAMPLPPATLQTATEVLLDIVEGARPPALYEDLHQVGEWSADRSAARGLPLMKLPQAAGLITVATENATDNTTTAERVTAGCTRLAAEAPFEARLFLARALDPFWQTSCTADSCLHIWAFALVHAMLEGAVLGPYSHSTGRRMPRHLTTSIDVHFRSAQPDEIDVNQLEPAIRACAFAAASHACVSREARALLDVLLDAHRRALLEESGHDRRGELALGAARAVLRVAHAGDSQPLHHHIEELSGNDELLDRALTGLAAVAEESSWGSSTARRLWPEVITQITGITRLHVPKNPRHFDYEPLAAAVPRKTLDMEFFHRELSQLPREWRDLLEWRPAIEEWLLPAAGQPQCVAALIGLLRTLPVTDQAEIGLPWVADLVFARPSAMVPRPHALPEWLISIHTAADELGASSLWQRVVDDLVVSGCSQLAGYAD